MSVASKVFLMRKTPVKNTIVTYTFSYTPLSDTCKSLKVNKDRSVQSSHNPLTLGSNPSGPSLILVAESERIREVCCGLRKVRTELLRRKGAAHRASAGNLFTGAFPCLRNTSRFPLELLSEPKDTVPACSREPHRQILPSRSRGSRNPC